MTKYFKDYSKNSSPPRLIYLKFILIYVRKYLLNVVNTINENSVINAVKQVKEQRQKKKINEAPICITREFAELLNSFNSISQDQTIKGLHGLKDYP